jgi:hypothetical protein
MLLLSVSLGGFAGFAANAFGGSTNLSMAATFFGAIVPLLWQARRNRTRRGDSG